ncbi:hypothetical protein ACUN0C_10270 [Faunimonas sp. B44]|uniref:hypothetical protein n=1 Tax=Faunimonas sp. B44 TaxID=3461493 RepID=UPI004044B77F
MALFTIAATGVSIYAVRLVNRTLAANISAVNEAKGANAIAQANAEADRRPWLDFTITRLTLVGVQPDGRLKCQAQIDMRNLGKTPATGVFVFLRMEEVPAPFFGSLEKLSKGRVDRTNNVRAEGGRIIFPSDKPVSTLETAIARFAFAADDRDNAAGFFLNACVEAVYNIPSGRGITMKCFRIGCVRDGALSAFHRVSGDDPFKDVCMIELGPSFVS